MRFSSGTHTYTCNCDIWCFFSVLNTN